MKKAAPKYLFVVGGVISGVGKGIASSSIAKILKDRGFSVTALKIDPYINVDAGTMNPTEHGEVFVLKDGDETDQDMGNYERFLNIDLTRTNYMTTGRVYQTVIEAERAMKYGGRCVEVVPHIPMEVIRRIDAAQKAARANVVIIEVGGTVGEYQNMLFLEAARMMKIKHPSDVFFAMVSYLPVPSTLGEMKTKPTQSAVRTLNASGLQPDILIARGVSALDEKRKEKIAFSCSIAPERIISAPDVSSVYDVPLNFEKEKLGDLLCTLFGDTKHVKRESSESRAWKQFAKKVHTATDTVRIAVVGKYFTSGEYLLGDAYLSVIEGIKYSAYAQNKKPVIEWFNAADFEKDPKKISELSNFDGVLVPGGFGSRGVEGMVAAIKYIREKKIPYFGICYGMQLAVIEFARHVAGLKGANTTEVDAATPYPVIDIMEQQKKHLADNKLGGSMRLGSYEAYLKEGTIARKAYAAKVVVERHRHRYEVNTDFISRIEKAGMVFSGTSPDGHLMEIAELPQSVHPFFIGVQFHPEFLARPLSPHKIFSAFIQAAVAQKNKNKKK